MDVKALDRSQDKRKWELQLSVSHKPTPFDFPLRRTQDRLRVNGQSAVPPFILRFPSGRTGRVGWQGPLRGWMPGIDSGSGGGMTGGGPFDKLRVSGGGGAPSGKGELGAGCAAVHPSISPFDWLRTGSGQTGGEIPVFTGMTGWGRALRFPSGRTGRVGWQGRLRGWMPGIDSGSGAGMTVGGRSTSSG